MRRRDPRSAVRDDRGTSMVEFALALPLLALVALGIVEVGRYTAYSIVVGNAVKAGATAGAVSEIEAQATPDPNQSPGTNLDKMASQVACIDAYHDLSVGNSSFSCTSSGSAAPVNTLKITSTITCYLNGVLESPCDTTVQPAPAGRTVYITVAAAGQFKPLFNYPLLPPYSTMSAQTTLQVGL